MAKKERFALMMEDGAQVRNIDDLKAHFDIGSVVRDFSSGKLLTWLEDRYYDDEADAIRALNVNDNLLEAKLCRIFDMETPEEIERRILAKKFCQKSIKGTKERRTAELFRQCLMKRCANLSARNITKKH